MSFSPPKKRARKAPALAASDVENHPDAPRSTDPSKTTLLLSKLHQQPTLDFGWVAPGASATATLTVCNDTAAAASVVLDKAVRAPFAFAVPFAEILLQAGASTCIALVFAPSEAGGVAESLALKCGRFRRPVKLAGVGGDPARRGVRSAAAAKHQAARSLLGRAPAAPAVAADAAAAVPAPVPAPAAVAADADEWATGVDALALIEVTQRQAAAVLAHRLSLSGTAQPATAQPAAAAAEVAVADAPAATAAAAAAAPVPTPARPAPKRAAPSLAKSLAKTRVTKAKLALKKAAVDESLAAATSASTAVPAAAPPTADTLGPQGMVPSVAGSNMFFDDHWAAKQERGFTAWLNFVLGSQAVPLSAHADAAESADGAAGTTTHAAIARERAATAVRARARALFTSPAVAATLCRIEAAVSDGRLRIRTDRDLHADMGLRTAALALLSAYSPQWLALGLEALLGLAITTPAESLEPYLRLLLSTRVLADAEVAAAYAGLTQGVYREGFAEAVKATALKRVLMLAVFLDAAKGEALLSGVPLFRRDAGEVKSTAALLRAFSAEVLAGEGDIVRHLSSLGVRVCVEQGPVDEAIFAVRNLATDIADGAVLARLADIVLGPGTGAVAALRLPAASTASRVHNIKAALAAFTTAGWRLPGVKAEPIAAGHREKTLALLWQIASHVTSHGLIDVPALTAELARLARLHAVAGRPALQSVELLFAGSGPEAPALSLLLAWAQSVAHRFGVPVRNFTSSFSDGRVFCLLIHAYHPETLPLSAISMHTTVTLAADESARQFADESLGAHGWAKSYSPTMGRSYKAAQRAERRNFASLRAAVASLGGVPQVLDAADCSETLPDERVVVTFLAYLASRVTVLSAEVRAAVVIQTAWRRARALAAMRGREAAVVRAQAVVRGWLARRAVARLRVAKAAAVRQAAAVCAQTAVRGWLARGVAGRMRVAKAQAAVEAAAAALALQTRFRAVQARRRVAAVRALKQTVRAEAVAAFAARTKAALAAVAIQRATRVMLARRSEARGTAALAIQAAFRGHCGRLRAAAVAAIRSSVQAAAAADRIQAFVTSLRVHLAATMLQRAFRRHTVRALTRAQQAAEAAAAREVAAAVTLQAAARGRAARREAAERAAAADTLTRWAATRVAAVQFRKTRGAALALQTRFRAVQARRRVAAVRALKQTVRAEVVAAFAARTKALLAAVAIQRAARVMLARRSEARGTAALAIQAVFRGHCGRRRAAAVAAIRSSVQAAAAADRIQAFATSLRVHLAATMLQRAFRRHTVRALTRAQQAAEAAAAHQAAVKAAAADTLTRWAATRIATAQFRKTRGAALALQTRFRAVQARRRVAAVRTLKQTVRAEAVAAFAARTKAALAAVAMQRATRVMLARRSEARGTAALAIQAVFRGHCGRRRAAAVAAIRSSVQAAAAAERLQSFVTSLRLHLAATMLQRAFRSFALRRCARDRMASILALQGWARTIAQRRRYLATLAAVRTIQSAAQTHLARKALAAARAALATRSAAALTLQAWARGCAVRARQPASWAARRARIRAVNAAVQDHMRLGNRTQAALDVLLSSKQLTKIHAACLHLASTTRLSRVCCESLAAHAAVPIVFNLVKSLNRSAPHVDLLKLCLQILRNLTHWRQTIGAVFEASESLDVLVEIAQIYRDKPEVFVNVAHILARFASVPEWAAAMRGMADAIKRLQSIQGLLDRKAAVELKSAARRGGPASAAGAAASARGSPRGKGAGETAAASAEALRAFLSVVLQKQ